MHHVNSDFSLGTFLLQGQLERGLPRSTYGLQGAGLFMCNPLLGLNALKCSMTGS